MSEIGMVYFRVYYDGIIQQLTVKKLDAGKPTFSVANLTSIKDDEYKLLATPLEIGVIQSFDFDVMKGKPNQFFSCLEDAKKISVENFKREISPCAMYKVARYFGDMFVSFVTAPMSKKDAKNEAEKLNSKSICYVHYEILAVK